MPGALLRHLPAIEKLKVRLLDQHPGWPDWLATTVCRETVDAVRAATLAGEIGSEKALVSAVDHGLRDRIQLVVGPILRPLHNGTGVLVHTNAGRAPLATAAIAAISETSAGYCNLELHLSDGRRGSRQGLLKPLLRWLTGAEDGLVVNNNAAAVMLALHAIAAGRPVLVSRGELVEIGGSFRVPDVMRAAGARLVEVGTTNRTWLRDYENAARELTDAGDPPAAMMQVHRSNFRIEGFVNTPELADLVALGRGLNIPVIADLGSGALHDPASFGLADEPTVAEVIAAGADLATFSGDKLVGGPQAGVIVGAKRWTKALGGNAMARAVRVDSMTLAGLEATLRMHLLGRARHDVPVLAAASMKLPKVREAGDSLARSLAEIDGLRVGLVNSEARVGGGSQPGETLPSFAVKLTHDRIGATALANRLRNGAPPVLARVRDEAVVLDVRSLVCRSDAQTALRQVADAIKAASV